MGSKNTGVENVQPLQNTRGGASPAPTESQIEKVIAKEIVLAAELEESINFFDELFKEKNVRELVKYKANLSLEGIFERPKKAIVQYRKDHMDELEKTVAKMLLDLSESVNCQYNLSVKQLMKCATEIALGEDWYYLSLEDLMLVCKMIEKGEFGEVYRLDSNYILSKIKAYLKIRADEAEQISHREHQRHKDMLGQKLPDYRFDESGIAKNQDLRRRWNMNSPSENSRAGAS